MSQQPPHEQPFPNPVPAGSTTNTRPGGTPVKILAPAIALLCVAGVNGLFA